MLSVSIDLSAAKSLLDNAQKQLPFACSRAINATLKDAQTEIVNNMKTAMTIRNQNFLKYSVKLTKQARKNDLEGILAIADMPNRSTADILGKFDASSNITQKLPKQASTLAIPTQHLRVTKATVIPASKLPKNLTNAQKMRSKTGIDYLAIPMNKGKHRQLTPVYILSTRGVPIAHLFDFESVGKRVILANFQSNFDAAFEQAMATAH